MQRRSGIPACALQATLTTFFRPGFYLRAGRNQEALLDREAGAAKIVPEGGVVNTC